MAHWPTSRRSRGLSTTGRCSTAIIRETTSHGIEPFLFFYGTPDWAARADGHNCNVGDCSIFPPASTRDPRARSPTSPAAAVDALRARRRLLGGAGAGPAAAAAGDAVGGGPPATGSRATDCPIPICPPPPPPPPPPPGPPPPHRAAVRLHRAAPDHHLADLERAELAQVLRAQGQRRALRRDAQGARATRSRPTTRAPRCPRRHVGPASARKKVVLPGEAPTSSASTRSTGSRTASTRSRCTRTPERRGARSSSSRLARKIAKQAGDRRRRASGSPSSAGPRGGPRERPLRQGTAGPGADALARALEVRAQAAPASTSAACSGTRGATSPEATRSASGAATPGCATRTARRSRPGERSRVAT